MGEIAEGKRHRRTALVLAFALFAVGVAAIPARLFVGDPYTWREEAINLLLFHKLEIPARIALSHGVRNQYFTQNPRTGAWYSKYGVMSGLLNLIPLYAEMKVTHKLPAFDSPKRRLFLGFFYAVLGSLFSLVLYRICAGYGAPPAACALFVLTTVFCTYAGYYLRATNSEAYQLLFYTAFFACAAAYRASGFRAHGKLYLAWLWLLCLVHVKVSHLLVVAVFAVLLLGWELWRGSRGAELARLVALRIGLPVAVIAATVGMLNFWKFGSVVGTGYTMWDADMFVHNIPPWTMVRNVFFTMQWGVPVHFPLVVLAAFGAREFWRRFPFDLLLAALSFLATFAAVASMPVWKGEWAYGPRYFLFALPALSLPALLCFERFLAVEERRKPAIGALLACTVLVAAVSAYFQIQVARLDPFFCYWARPNIAAYHDDVLSDYWNTTYFGWIAREAWAHRDHPEDLWWMRRLKNELPPRQYDREKERIETWLKRTDFYWWSPQD